MIENILLALGGNLPSQVGEPQDTLSAALVRLNEAGITLLSVSRFFETPCFPAGAGPDYVNAAVTVASDLTPRDLLRRLHEIEAEFGRERDTRWGMRTLDIDLIAMGDLVLPDEATQRSWQTLPMEEQVRATPEQLILPHPRLQDRAFVIGPLMDVAPQWKHPLTGQTVAEIHAQLPKQDLAALKSL
ncbi:2-amino-4-hydroxy-6-hydroxymethyldihydropteridine pyrophosphokinase [Shimia sp. SK013]|uniref:2-amino-4-hydroxy-6- hydroxymethyldihydropteridine diphosphokinase n=1 Tax=Shimia sp. SK013 TaxID=1389006 RepID=UPI0006B65552|nr:2-amino-4-hydroxy-6-hydroxymethyldihydropteridine diphosphokinase [Shimia sp. SK013]KPA23541.1 2-amino-4-hydroxy-6-hydroxymethyldihydropteridine pyrophosphokinase [Shimia sp. SK013]